MSDYPLLDLFLTMLWFFLWILWFILLFRVVIDLFRDDNLSGWAKAGWTVLVCVLPFLGVFIYLVARGRDMGRRERRHMQAQETAFREYIRDAAREPAPADSRNGLDELERLATLHNNGDLTDEEYERAKSSLLTAH